MARDKPYATVGDIGRVTIPRQTRRQLGIESGTELAFEVRGRTIVVTKAGSGDRVAAVFGIAGRPRTDKVITVVDSGLRVLDPSV